MSSSKSLVLSERVEAILNDAVANLKLLEFVCFFLLFFLFPFFLVRELASRNTRMEVEKLQLQAGKDELEAAKLELQAVRAEFKAEKAALKAERMQLEGEKTQLRVSQVQLKVAQSQLEDAKSQLELARVDLDEARAQLETARTHLEAARAEAMVDCKNLEAAKASLEEAKARFLAATRQLNAAKSRFEAAKVLLDAATAKEAVEKSDHTISNEDKIAKLEIRISELQSERSKSQTTINFLETDVSNLTVEVSKQRAEMEGFVKKVGEMEKQLDQCCNDKKVVQDEKSNQTLTSDKVFFDVEISGRRAGLVVIKLDYDTTPLTAEYFRVLCSGGRDTHPHYNGKRFAVYDGAIAIPDDKSGIMYHFPAENFTKKHVPGAVSLLFRNGRVHENRFIISTTNLPGYDGTHVVFGHVIEGMNLVMKMQSAGGSVIECGLLS